MGQFALLEHNMIIAVSERQPPVHCYLVLPLPGLTSFLWRVCLCVFVACCLCTAIHPLSSSRSLASTLPMRLPSGTGWEGGTVVSDQQQEQGQQHGTNATMVY